MKNKLVVFGILGVAFVLCLVVIGGGVYAIRHLAAERRAQREQELERELEEDRRDAAAAFTDLVPPTAEEARTFQEVLEKLGKALDAKSEHQVERLFDTERFVRELGRRGAFDKFPGGNSKANRDAFLKGMRQGGGFGQSLSQDQLFRWQETKVRRVRWSADRNEAVVISVHKTDANDDEPERMHWWFTRSGTTWKVYDYEVLEFGLRISRLIALLLPSGIDWQKKSEVAQLETALKNLQEASVAIVDTKDLDQAERCLNQVRHIRLPAPLASIFSILDGRVKLERGKHDEALALFSQAERLNPDMPVVNYLKAVALAGAERLSEALPLVRQYIKELGPDPKGLFLEGIVLERLNRNVEARDSFRKVLDEQPAQLDALNGLRRVLPKEEKKELADRIARAPDPAKLTRELIKLAEDDGDNATAAALLVGLRKAKPDDIEVLRDSIRTLIGEGQFTEASRLVQRHLKEGPEKVRLPILHAYLGAMYDARRTEEAYAAVPDQYAHEAFLYLANELEDDVLEGDDVNADIKRMRQLLSAHRKRMPKDAWLPFFEGIILQQAKDYEAAEQKYAVAEKLLKDAPRKNMDDDEGADRIRMRRVQCYYELKQGLKAYQEVGPPTETFRQLADAYLRDKDLENLSDLVKTHTRALPKELSGTYWNAELLFAREKYSEAANAFHSYSKVAQENGFRLPQARYQCLRGYIRANRAAEARTFLASLQSDDVPAGLRAAVALADGRPGNAELILAEEAKKPNGLRFLYFDPDLARIIAEPRYANLRKKFPDPNTQQEDPNR